MLFSGLFRRALGSRNQRLIKRMSKVVKKINALEPELSKLDDQALSAKTQAFRDRLKEGESLDSLLVEAFAVVREASKRTLGMRHFDVQLIGGMVLHQGKIAEMRTGEGKTLMSTLAAYLNALPEKGVHLITVNDYLAKRDAEWMKPVYDFLGLSIGINLPNMSPDEKREAYAADITYSTNNECGFDYLRDNMAFSLSDKVQRDLHYAIIDEVDSILIDEARTPLIISGPSDDSSASYKNVDAVIPQLTPREGEEGPGDYYLDEKNKQAFLTEAGHQHVEELLAKAGLLEEGSSLYDASNITLNHYVNAALRAHTLFQKDVDYIVKDSEVIIVDEHTGRTMEGRRWSEGLHQAIEAKERVDIQQENKTLASITFQNFFRVYGKLSGMTGTADTEAYELQEIYNLEVVVIPTNKPMVRKDSADKVFLKQEGKFKALIEDVKACHEKGQPVLVGTASVEASEHLSNLLNEAGIKHNVLNAKFHAKEANIIVEAGCPGAVTIATNMAGRGTDIVLGGNLDFEIEQLGENPDPAKVDALKAEWKKRQDAVLKSGGLAVLGSERHQSRRIDNQLRGRSGRQGDPGASRFYLSMQDDLMRIFASDRVTGLMQKLGMKDDEAIEHSWINKAIASAQRKVEGFHFDVRKELLEYDNVANDQRKVIYDQRNQLLHDGAQEDLKAMRHEVIDRVVSMYIRPNSLEEQWDVKVLEEELAGEFGLKTALSEKLAEDKSMDHGAIVDYLVELFEKAYDEKIAKAGEESMQQFEKSVMLQTLDSHWREHLSAMDHLRQGIHLRGYAQKNPKQEYRREAFNLFVELLDNIKYDVIKVLSAVQIDENAAAAVDEQRREAASVNVSYQHNDFSPEEVAELPSDESAELPVEEPAVQQPMRREMPKVGRNDPCPCGSGKKYKQCHGQV